MSWAGYQTDHAADKAADQRHVAVCCQLTRASSSAPAHLHRSCCGNDFWLHWPQFLQLIAEALRPLGPRAAFYLAAAVSDFFVPWADMVWHLNFDTMPK